MGRVNSEGVVVALLRFIVVALRTCELLLPIVQQRCDANRQFTGIAGGTRLHANTAHMQTTPCPRLGARSSGREPQAAISQAML